jgi:hypothetical protein
MKVLISIILVTCFCLNGIAQEKYSEEKKEQRIKIKKIEIKKTKINQGKTDKQPNYKKESKTENKKTQQPGKITVIRNEQKRSTKSRQLQPEGSASTSGPRQDLKKDASETVVENKDLKNSQNNPKKLKRREK